MDSISYLNTISAETKAKGKKNSTNGLFGGKIKKFLIAAGAVIALCIIIGIISNISSHETDFVPRLNLRSTNLNTIVQKFNPSVKSSSLRAAGSSLIAITENLSVNLATKYIEKDAEPSETVTEEETIIATNSENTLTNAKINGLLDRYYAHEMNYNISILLALIQETINQTEDNTLITLLLSISESLEKIQPTFASFSDTAK